MAEQLNYLGAARISRLINGLQDPRLLPANLTWTQRVGFTDAMDEEITARFTGVAKMADLVADDAKAVTYSMGRFTYEVTKIPNIKVGVAMNQAALNKMSDLAQYYPGGIGTAPNTDRNLISFTNWEQRAMDTVNLGVQQRVEQLNIAMICDGIGFTYDRLGIKLAGVTWGMYPDLKATATIAWDNVNATPVNDLLALKLIGKLRYGIDYDRVSMGTQAFRYMIATTEFQAKAKLYVPAQLAQNNYSSFLNLQNLDQQRVFAGNVLGMTIELYDTRAWQQDENGAEAQVPLWPITNVALTDSREDGRKTSYDFGNGITTESIVANAAGNTAIIGGSIPAGFGPVAYATPADVSLNSPGIVYWGVRRGFPRKFRQQSSAVISVGAFTDQIPTTVPAVV